MFWLFDSGIPENRENPFNANGELSQKADYILSHSTITRTEVVIADPDAQQNAAGGDQSNEVVVAKTVQSMHASPPSGSDGRPGDAGVTTASVEVEVAKGSAAAAQPQHAEEVKLKSKKKCCTILWIALVTSLGIFMYTGSSHFTMAEPVVEGCLGMAFWCDAIMFWQKSVAFVIACVCHALNKHVVNLSPQLINFNAKSYYFW